MSSALESYRKNGFYVARGVLPQDALDDACRDMTQVLAQQIERLGGKAAPFTGMESLYENLKTLHHADIPAYLASLTLWAKLYSVHAMIMHPRLRAVARELGISLPCFQTQPVFHLVSDQLLIPNGYQGFETHQDWTALQSSLDTVVTWIPFMDVDRDLFTMDVVPGSHLLGLCEGQQRQHVFEVDPRYFREELFAPVEVRRGDVFIMSVFMLHRSSKRGRPGALRLSCSARYENAAEPTFAQRGYPFTQKRVVERAILHPGFPTAEQVREVFGVAERDEP